MPADLSGANPWSTAGFQLRGLSQTARVCEVLDLAVLDFMQPDDLCAANHARRRDAESREILQSRCADLFSDPSQNPVRKPYTCPSSMVSRCLTTTSTVYSHGRDRVCLPVEHMLWQGHRLETKFPSSMRQSSIRELAGQGIALPCLATIVYCLHHTGSLSV